MVVFLIVPRCFNLFGLFQVTWCFFVSCFDLVLSGPR